MYKASNSCNLLKPPQLPKTLLIGNVSLHLKFQLCVHSSICHDENNTTDFIADLSKSVKHDGLILFFDSYSLAIIKTQTKVVVIDSRTNNQECQFSMTHAAVILWLCKHFDSFRLCA